MGSKISSETSSFIVFSDDWGDHPSSCQHLFRIISQEHRVIWVNTIGMRNPTLTITDASKAFRKVRRMVMGTKYKTSSEEVNLNITVCQPPMFPFNQLETVRRINKMSVIRTVRSLLFAQNVIHPILVTSVPNACDYIGAFGEIKVVYYCVDDFKGWPGFERYLVHEMEENLVRRSDILIATSKKLFKKLTKTGKPTYLLTHGVDVELFSEVSPFDHPCLEKIPKPRVGFFGLVDNRSDQKLIEEVASRKKDLSFIFTGPIETDVERLNKLENVYFTGPVHYRELPSLIHGLEALFIPYITNAFSDSLSPLKLKEYLATGKPVISTPIAEACLRSDYLIIAATAEEWLTALDNALRNDIKASRESLLIYIKSQSWTKKADSFLKLSEAITLPKKHAELKKWI